MPRGLVYKTQYAQVVKLRRDFPDETPAETYRRVTLDATGGPTIRTVEAWINKNEPRGPDWNPKDANPDEFRAVAHVLRWIRTHTQTKRWITDREAKRIAWIAARAPAMHAKAPERVWSLARLYVVHEQTKRSTRELDEWLVDVGSKDSDGESKEVDAATFTVPDRRRVITSARLSELGDTSEWATDFPGFWTKPREGQEDH